MSEVLSPLLVGRAAQLAEIESLLRRAREGNGRVLAVTGEPGVGKSRLVREALALAAPTGTTTFTGRATRSGGPFAALTSALLTYGRTHPLPSAPELEPFRAALGPIVPEWRASAQPLPPQASDTVPVVSEGLLRLLRAAAPRGALLVLEDLHWADPETLQVLDYFADAVAEERISCLVTLRDDDLAAATTSSWVAGLLARRAARRVELGRLTADETRELARACLGSPDLPHELEEFIVDNADGLPLLVEDLLASVIAAGAVVRHGTGWRVTHPLAVGVPQTFAETVDQRLTQLDDKSRRTVAAAAVVGRRFDWRLLPHVTGYDEATVLDALRAAVGSQIIVADDDAGPQQFRFRHALTRDVVLLRLLPPERAALSGAAARAIEAQHPDLPENAQILVADLYADAGSHDRAAELLLDVGRRALSRGALASAQRALTRARVLAHDIAVVSAADTALTQALALAGDVDAAFRVGNALLSRSDARISVDERADVQLWLARAAVTAGDSQRAATHLDAVAADGADSSRLMHATVLRALVALNEGRVGEAESLAADALERAERAHLWDVACESLELLGRCARPSDASVAERAFERAHRIAVEHGLDLWQVRALHELGTIDLYESGRVDRLAAARELAATSGAFVTGAHVDLHLGIVLANRDDAEGATDALQRALATAVRLRLRDLHRASLAQFGYVLALAGRGSDAASYIARVVDEDDDVDAAHVIADGFARPLVLLLEENITGAISKLDAAVEHLNHGGWPHWGLRALLRAVADDRGEQAIAEAEEVGGRGRPLAFNAAHVAFARAVIAGRAGRRSEAAAAFEQADAELGWRNAHRRFCWRHVAEAAVNDGWGEPVKWLRHALAEFDDRGVVPVAAACRRLLSAAGSPVPRRGRGDTDVPPHLLALGVTSREADVLTMVVAGLSNPQIAAQLHLSPRTVETHVARLLAKTGTSTRRELAARAKSVPTST